jgi:hypothetical protein
VPSGVLSRPLDTLSLFVSPSWSTETERFADRAFGELVPSTLLELRLAARAYVIAKGKLPDSLDALVPEFLPNVPRDPYDGKPVRYIPDTGEVYLIGDNYRDDGGLWDEFPSPLIHGSWDEMTEYSTDQKRRLRQWIGARAPSLTAVGPNGEVRRLRRLRGRRVLLVPVGSVSSPVVENDSPLPSLQRVREAIPADRLEILAVESLCLFQEEHLGSIRKDAGCTFFLGRPPVAQFCLPEPYSWPAAWHSSFLVDRNGVFLEILPWVPEPEALIKILDGPDYAGPPKDPPESPYRPRS